MYKAVVTINLKKSILDPQGSVVLKSLKALGYSDVEEVRVGKHIELQISADSEEKALEQAKEMCAKLLANPVIEEYHVEVTEVRA